MFQHARIEQTTGLRIYFAGPHSPWQRGTKENTNGLLRQYLPKGTDLNSYPQPELQRIAAEPNNRPGYAWQTAPPPSSCDDGTSQQQPRFATTPRNRPSSKALADIRAAAGRRHVLASRVWIIPGGGEDRGPRWSG